MVTRTSSAIVGVAESDLGVTNGKTALQLQSEAARDALAEAGLKFSDVDGLLTAGRDDPLASTQVAEYLGIDPRFSDSTNIGGASFLAHVQHATAAIASGYCEVALITYGSTQRSLRERTLGRTGGLRGTNQFEGIWGLPVPVGAYALAATRHMHDYGTTSEQLAEVAVAARGWANLNPKAFCRELIGIEDVLNSPMIADPLHLLDCCLVTDGGGAVVIVGADRARDLPGTPVWVLGHGVAHSHLTIANMSDLTSTSAMQSGRRALGMAGVSLEDIHVAEIYDSFTITVLLSLESLGFCGPGESGPFIEQGRLRPGGDLPMNTNGGGLSYCHPGMYGIFTLIEATRQLRGESGIRQVPGARVALCHGTGGVFSSSATVVLGRD